MENLSIALAQHITKDNQFKLDLINNLNTEDVTKLDWRLLDLLTKGQKAKQFSLEQLKEVLKQRLNKHLEKSLNQELKNLEFSDLPKIETLTINVEWKKSNMWGMNPTAEAYINGVGQVSSGSIGGCGYDKQSTAVARVLNQVPQFLKLMYELKNKNVEIKNHELFGYGSGYYVLPSFEGGVGVSCYPKIFEKIGYKFETVASGKTFDVYKITKL